MNIPTLKELREMHERNETWRAENELPFVPMTDQERWEMENFQYEPEFYDTRREQA